MKFYATEPVESFYFHWPFCPYKCHFCPFVALASHDQYMGQYHDALKKEFLSFSSTHQLSPLKTIFLGGGTPSTYPEDLLLDMFDTLYKKCTFDSQAEISLEVNPGTVTPQKIQTWKRAGITRLSVGVQSLNDNVLQKLNRHQKAQDVFDFFEYALPLFDNISIDLIIGLPGITPADWKELLETIVRWPIKHVSLYVLMVHEDTPLYFGIKNKRIALPADEEVIELYEWSVATLATYGFSQYEISNFSRLGYESKHNSVYWHRKPYKGFGLGACSFDGKRRIQNEKNLMSYLAHSECNSDIVLSCEELTSYDAWLETVMLGIRLNKGVSMRSILTNQSEDKQKNIQTLLNDCVQHGLLALENDIIKLTVRGRALEHEIVARLASL